MNNRLTVCDLIDFILLNRGTTTFMNMDELRIASMIQEALTDGILFYSVDSTNKLTGMILAIRDERQKIIFVTENLAMNLTNLKAYAKRAKEQWPEYNLQAIRHGSHRKFNTNKLYIKLT